MNKISSQLKDTGVSSLLSGATGVDELVVTSFRKLKQYCEKEEFKGWDPYDGLNSKVFRSLPLVRNNRLARLAWIQFFKRSPINLRRLLMVPKEYNAKGVGLFLSGYCKEYRHKPSEEVKRRIVMLADTVIGLQSPNYSGSCWGYNFDWQARAFFQPKNTPTVVATSFIANALLDAYDVTSNDRYLKTASSACNFFLKDLNRTYDANGNFAFSYSPLDKSVVFNASLLGGQLLSRVYSYTGQEILKTEARKTMAFCCEHQRRDGSWGYGTLPFHQWVDNFHTGYNLECMADYAHYTGDQSFAGHMERGFTYYINTFFTDDGIPKYYNNSVYPIDVHAPTQLVMTLSKLKRFHAHKEIVDKVLHWTIRHMQSEKGYFYYQINKYFTSRIPYMRWAQAWMFHAMQTYMLEEAVRSAGQKLPNEKSQH